MTHADVAVLGAGIIGCAVADELARRGARVTVLDPRPPGSGATWASAGVLAPYIEAHERGPLLDLTLESLALYDRFIDVVSSGAGREIEYRRSGTLEVALDEDRAAALRGFGTSMPAGTAEWLDPAALGRLEPRVRGAQGALLCPVHGYVNVPALLDALVASAGRQGVRFQTGVPVDSVSKAEGRRLRVDAGGQTVVVVDRVVVCAGSWSGTIEGVSELRDDVRPIRGQLVRLRCPAPVLRRVLWGPDCYIVPWEDGMVLVGATAEDVGFDERATASGVSGLLEAAVRLVPALADAEFVDVRVGLRPASASGLPVVRPSRDVPGLLLATGHYRNGILLAPLTAKRIGEISGI